MARISKSPDERRSELIACAQHLFYTKGYESTSVSDIVKEVGVAKGTFYYYFDSKLAILEAMIEELAAQTMVLVGHIVNDGTLDAIEKWVLTAQVINDWKIDHKDELLAIMQAMRKEENMILQFKSQKKLAQTLVPELTKIVVQGVDEALFKVEFAEESAEIAFAIQNAMADTFVDLILFPENYDEPAALAKRKIAAMQTAIERVFGAPPESLPLIDEQSLIPWFENQKERVS